MIDLEKYRCSIVPQVGRLIKCTCRSDGRIRYGVVIGVGSKHPTMHRHVDFPAKSIWAHWSYFEDLRESRQYVAYLNAGSLNTVWEYID